MAEMEADEQIKVRLPREDAIALRATAEARGLPVAAVVRQAVTEYLARREGDRAVPIIDATFAKHVDRLAGLIVKVYVAASASSWQANRLMDTLTSLDPVAEMKSAVARALVDLRRNGSALGEATEEEYEAAEERAGLPPVATPGE